MNAGLRFPERVVQGAVSLLKGVRGTAWRRSVRITYGWLLFALCLLSLLLNLGGLAIVWRLSTWKDEASTALAVATIAARVAGAALVLLVSPIFALGLCNLFFPFFSEQTFLAGMRIVSPALARELESGPKLSTWASVGNSLRRYFRVLPLLLGCFLLSLVPMIGPLLAPPLSLYVSARAVGWELLEPYFELSNLRWKAQSKAVKETLPELVGMGMVSIPLLAIPLIGPLFFGLLLAGSANFAREFMHKKRPQPELP